MLISKYILKYRNQIIFISKDSENFEGDPIIIILYKDHVFKYDGFILNMVIISNMCNDRLRICLGHIR